MPPVNPPAGGWKGVLERRRADHRSERGRLRRYWGGGLALAAGAAAAVVGLRLEFGAFFATPERNEAEAAANASQMSFSEDALQANDFFSGAATVTPAKLEEMDMDALAELFQFQEARLRALPAVHRAGSVVELHALGLATELEDQIALLDEGLIPASLNLDDRAVPRRLLQQRAMLMDDLFSLRRAEAAQAGFMHADF